MTSWLRRLFVEGIRIARVTVAPLAFQTIESHLVEPGVDSDGQTGTIPAGSTHIYVWVESGSVLVAFGEATSVATGTSDLALGNGIRMTSRGILWPIGDITQGDSTIHVRPTAVASVEVSFLRDSN